MTPRLSVHWTLWYAALAPANGPASCRHGLAIVAAAPGLEQSGSDPPGLHIRTVAMAPARVLGLPSSSTCTAARIAGTAAGTALGLGRRLGAKRNPHTTLSMQGS